jgi:threonine dehydratase
MVRNYEALSEQVNLLGVVRARAAINRYLTRTNLTFYSELSRLVGADVFVKHENHNPTGSFKIRGAINFFRHMSGEELETGILVATRGNYGLAMAAAGRWFDVPCTVVVPENNNPEINRIVESCGAELLVRGRDFYDAQSYCYDLVDTAGFYYVEQGTEPEILNGLGTMGLEIFEDLPDVDTIICPIGGGAGCASLVRVAEAVAPHVEIIGVQAERIAAYHASLLAGERVTLDVADTVADGLAARSIFHIPYIIMKDKVTDVVLLTEEEILGGIRLALEVTHNLAEGAGAAALAAAMKIKDRLAGKKVAVIMSGGNLANEHLLQALR